MAVEKFIPMRKRFVKLTLRVRTKWITPCERASKTVPENGVRSCVHFCLRPLEPLERCDLLPPIVEILGLLSGKKSSGASSCSINFLRFAPEKKFVVKGSKQSESLLYNLT